MTKKRYHKLFVALMTKLVREGQFNKGECGRLIKASATADPFGKGNYHSYQEAWDGMLGLRKAYNMIEK